MARSKRPPAALRVRSPRRRVIALTGVNTLVGQNLVGLYEEDPRVGKIIALDVQLPPSAGAKTRFYKTDLTSAGVSARLVEIFEAEDVDTVVHMAFVSDPSHAGGWAHELEAVGTMQVIGACEARRIRKLVMSSLTLLYGPSPSNPNFLSESHELRATRKSRFLRDKIDADLQAQALAARSPETIVTILRTAPVLGPTARNFMTSYLSRSVVPVVMGYDPLFQFLHEIDAVRAFKRAIDRDHPGVFNVVGHGVLPLSTVVRLAGRLALPVPHFLAPPLAAAFWMARGLEAPPTWVDFLRWICVADGAKAEREMGFLPVYSTHDALSEFVGAQRLRELRLLRDGST
jgi:UDP-glucose 4-epimerase